MIRRQPVEFKSSPHSLKIGQPEANRLFDVIFSSLLLSHSVVSESWRPQTVARQAPLSMGILHGRILEWVTMPFSGGSSQLRDRTQVSRMAGEFFTI